MKRKTRKIKGLLFYRGIIRKKVGILVRDKVRKMMEKEKNNLKKFSQKWKGNNQFQKEKLI